MSDNSNRRYYYDDEAVLESLRRSRKPELRQSAFRLFHKHLHQHALLRPLGLQTKQWALAWGELVEWSKNRERSATLKQPLATWLISFLVHEKKETKLLSSSYTYQYIPKKILVALVPKYQTIQEATAIIFKAPGLRLLNSYYRQFEQSLEDIFNEAITALFSHLPKDKKQEKATLFTYFMGIARNTCSSWNRKNKHQPKPLAEQESWDKLLQEQDQKIVENDQDFADVLSQCHRVIEQRFAFEDAGELVAKLLAIVQQNYREVIILRYIEEKSYEEISEQLGISEQNARSKVSRGIAQLRRLLKLKENESK